MLLRPQAHLKWREQNGIDTILEDFQFQVGAASPPLDSRTGLRCCRCRCRSAHWLPAAAPAARMPAHVAADAANLRRAPSPPCPQERDAFLSLYPQGYHKTDKMVGAGPAGAQRGTGTRALGLCH